MSITRPSMEYAGTLPHGSFPEHPVGPPQGGPSGGWVPPSMPPTPAAPSPNKPKRRGWLAMTAAALVAVVVLWLLARIRFAELVGARHAVAVNNGTTALVAALQRLTA